jgi:hypothetical protein
MSFMIGILGLMRHRELSCVGILERRNGNTYGDV